MKGFISTRILVGMLLLFPVAAHAQYRGEMVLEKTFEQSDFFFHPSHLNPYALGSFGSAAVGLLSDPLLNVQINPAYLATDSLPDQYAYVDFRSSRETLENHAYYGDYVGVARMDYIGYPYYFTRMRTETAPVFSGAYLARFGGQDRRLTLGATYQLIYQDERFYDVPQDIYRNNPESAFAADQTGASRNAIPIVDRYSGADGMQQRGHFGALYAAFRPWEGLDAGVRMGRVTFDRDGEFGSNNLWPSTMNRESLWRNFQERNQSYGHWDLSGGLNYRLSPDVVVGMTGGYLWGDVSQAIAQEDTSYSRYSHGFDDYSSSYVRAGFKDQHWFHDGSSHHAGVNLLARLTPRTQLQAFYRRSVENADIDLSSSLADTSYATSHYTYDGDESDYLSHSSVSDVRTGFGDAEQIGHRAAAYFHWSVNSATSVRLGGNLSSTRRRVRTEEDVTAHLHSYYLSTGRYPYESRRATDEDKTLHWDFESRAVSVQIPVFLSHRLSSVVDLLFGVNRRLLAWDITDVTLAIFDYRRRFEDGTTEIKENFGERYTEPREQLTDVQTTVIAGVTVTPAERFHIRMLVAPQFAQGFLGTTLREFQWWISLTATPGFRTSDRQ